MSSRARLCDALGARAVLAQRRRKLLYVCSAEECEPISACWSDTLHMRARLW